MAHSLISTRPLEIISNRRTENAKTPGKPPFFQISKAIFTEMDADRMGGNGDRLVWRVDAGSDKASALASHPAEPTLPLGIACRIDHSQQGFPDSRHAGESEDAPFESAHSMCLECPS
jgi:hypothetical protein